MTVRDELEQVAEAVRQREAVRRRMAARRLSLGVHSGAGTAIARSTVLDPMRHVDEALDEEAGEEPLLAQLEAEIEGGWDVVSGIAESGSEDGAQMCCRVYLWLEDWPQIARESGHTEEECRALLEMTLEWADGIGLARLREMGRGKRPYL